MMIVIAQVADPPAWVDRFAEVTPLGTLLFAAILTAIRVLLVLSSHDPASGRSWRRFADGASQLTDVIIFALVGVFFLIRPFLVQTFFIPTPSMVPTLQVQDYVVANKLVYRFAEPKVGDVAVFRPPPYALRPGQPPVDFVKRIVGGPGDVVEIRHGLLYRNGKPAAEPFLPEPPFQEDFKLVAYQGVRKRWQGQVIPVSTSPDGLGNYLTNTAPEFSVGYTEERGFLPLDETSEEDRAFMRELARAPPAPIPSGYFLMVGDNRNSSYDGRAWGLIHRSQVIGRCEFVWFPFSHAKRL